MKIQKFTALTVAAVLAIGLSACSGGGGSTGSKDTSPIVVGSVSALSGSATFPEASAAAKAVFDRANKSGGINGRKISYVVVDDKGQAASASSAARQVVSSSNAVALVGSASLIECQVNGSYYVQQKILSIQGTGVDPNCFKNPNIAPVNVGPYLDAEMTLVYASENLKLKKICGLLEVGGGSEPSYKASFAAWTKRTGQDFTLLDDTVPYGASDYTPYVVKAKAAGCDGLFTNGTQPDVIGTIKAAQTQGYNPTFLALTSVYSSEFAKAIGPTGAKVSVPAEFIPYVESNASATKDWADLMKADDIPLTSFAQGGYLSATYFVDILKKMKGDINRATVTAAIKAAAPISNPMVGTPWVFGNGSSHNPNKAGWMVTVTQDGAWSEAQDDWLILK